MNDFGTTPSGRRVTVRRLAGEERDAAMASRQPRAKQPDTLERLVRRYQADYYVSHTFFMDLLGIRSYGTWQKVREGRTELTVRQAVALAYVFDMPIEKLIAALPECNRPTM